MCLKELKSLLQFCTVLPLGVHGDFDAFANNSYLYPIAGYVTGGIAAIVVFWCGNPQIASALAIGTVLITSGCHHFDGLLDLGDGLMTHGSMEKRVSALTDRQIGAGGVAAGILVVLLTFAGLQGVHPVAWGILIGEVGGKMSMLVLTVAGAPFREGIHSYLHARARPVFLLYAAVLCLPLILLPFSVPQLAASGIAIVVCPAILLLVARHLFGGINGDIVGASNEITRAAVVLALALL